MAKVQSIRSRLTKRGKRPTGVHQFLIVLKGTDPLVWRRIQVPEAYSFWDLHVHGYVEFLEAIADPKHPEHEEMRSWAGTFDPNDFTSQGDVRRSEEALEEGIPRRLIDALRG